MISGARARRLDARLRALLGEPAGQRPPGLVDGQAVERTLAAVERHLAAREKALRRAEDRLALLGEAIAVAPLALVVTDASGVEVVWNPAAAELLSDAPDQAFAMPAVRRVLQRALGDGPVEQEIDLFGPPRRHLVVSARPLGARGAPMGTVAIVQDLTERRRIDEVRRDFVSNIGHELRTPVGALMALTEALADERDPEVLDRLLPRVAREAERLGAMVEDLLDLSTIEHNPGGRHTDLPVAAVVQETLDRVRAHAERFGVTVRTVAIDDGTVCGDRRQLVTALHNLADNAVKYSERGGEVRLSAVADGDAVAFSVADDGVGIPPRDRDRVFERFYRVDQARTRDTGGIGLGLAIVRHVANNHGGSVGLESVEGEGSTFTLRIPRRCAER